MKKAIRYGLLAAAFLLLAFLIYRKYFQAAVAENKYERSAQTVQEFERENPLQFLRIEAEFRKNMLGTKFNVSGKVINRATSAGYKDFEVQVTMYSGTASVVRKVKEMLYQTVQAGHEEFFEFKIDRPREADSCSIQLLKATAF